MVVSLVLFFVALTLMLAAVLSVLRARKVEQISKVNARLEQLAFLNADAPKKKPSPSLILALEKWLERVGMQLTPGTAIALLIGALLIGLTLLKTVGMIAAALWWGLLAIVAIIIPQIRYRQKLEKMIGQIPLFIDQIVRSLATGRNLEGSIKLAVEDMEEPLRGVIDRAQNNVELGADLGESLREAAHFYDVKELHMLALTIHTSRVFGGSPREMLESIVSLIRQREQMQRELRAMTGETRASAWVLGMLPSGVATYIFYVNPDYVLGMWKDPLGQTILLTALAMQVLGGLILWRMVKSI
jgi:tight adherence protein B